MNEFFARWETESPKFFKRLVRFGKWVAGAGAALVAATMVAPAEINKEVVDAVKLASSYMIFGGGILAAVSGLTVDSRDELDAKLQPKKDDVNQQ
jgi:hypothetical protein